MRSVTTKDGTEIFYQDWGDGLPVVFSHGWPLTSDAFESQMFFLASHGYRCVAHDRRGHGRSSPSWNGHDLDTYADDLATLLDALDLECATLVGHSIGCGEVLRYISRHGTRRITRLMLISVIEPRKPCPDRDASRTRAKMFDGLLSSLLRDRSQLWKDLSAPFYGYNRNRVAASPGVTDAFWLQAMSCGMPGAYHCIKLLAESDLSKDLGTIDVPTLILHGEDDQLLPAPASADSYAGLVRNATLEVVPGAPHGLCTTHKERVNETLLAFLSS